MENVFDEALKSLHEVLDFVNGVIAFMILGAT